MNWNQSKQPSPSVCLLGDGHDIRPIRIGEGQEHNHSVHCAIQRGEWGSPICPSLHVFQRMTVFQNTNASDHCFQSSILQELQSALPLMLWILLVFIFLSLLFSSCFRNRESLLFLNIAPSTTSRSRILLRETVAIISYPTSIERNRQQTERASIWRFTRFSRNVLLVKWSQNKTQPCVLIRRWNHQAVEWVVFFLFCDE